MFCTQCGNQLGDKDRYCSQCALPTGLGRPSGVERPLLRRDLQNKKIAGVCAGFARYLDVDPVLIRIVWLALAFGAGIGFVGYLIAWIVMPKDPVGTVTVNCDFARYPS
ncbi:MAG: PspC domain-containing protein [Bryobacteraceae bacterium]|jgi:phage shock protein C